MIRYSKNIIDSNIVYNLLTRIVYPTMNLRTESSYKPVYNNFATTNYIATHKIIHMYYLNKSYDSLNMSCD